MNLKKVNKIFKKKFLNLFMVNILFAAIYLLFLVLVRGKIRENMQLIQTLTPKIQNLAPLLEQSAEALPELEAALQQMGSLGNQTMFLFYLVPVVTIALWCVFQGFSWALLTDKVKKNLKLFFARFSIVSAVALSLLFGVGFLTISKMTSVFEITGSGFFAYLVFSFLIFYYLFVFYGFAIRNDDLKSTVKRAFEISFKKAPKLMPLFIPMFILLIIIVFTFFNFYTNRVIGSFNLVEMVPWTLFLFVILTVTIWYKIFLTVYLEKHR